MDLFDLPQTCLDRIGTILCEESEGYEGAPLNLLKASKTSYHQAFGSCIFEHYDPGCTGAFEELQKEMSPSPWVCPIRPPARDSIAGIDTKWTRKRTNSRLFAEGYPKDLSCRFPAMNLRDLLFGVGAPAASAASAASGPPLGAPESEGQKNNV